ncbi:MAG: DUF434 domain-containing protein [Spirochaetales bacterium]|nr:DUF434 domain-containing protein [Spirochaetales bacterium]
MSFRDAIDDYRFLRNRQYPPKALLKLVGDRYRLTRLQRNCLFRGVIQDEVAATRKKKMIRHEAVKARPLGIDWYNVLITIESYLKGFPVFISDDGVVRDSSGIHGSYRPTKITERAISEIFSVFTVLLPGRLDLYIDAPVSHSGEMARDLRGYCKARFHFPISIEVVPSADYPLKNYTGIVISSDSIVLDHAESVFDLVRHVLATRFEFTPPGLDRLVI